MVRERQDRSQSIGQTWKSWNVGHMVFFLTQGESGNWISFQLYDSVLSVEVMVGTVLNFPTDFDVSGFTFAQSAEVSELVSGFLTKGIRLCIVVLYHLVDVTLSFIFDKLEKIQVKYSF